MSPRNIEIANYYFYNDIEFQVGKIFLISEMTDQGSTDT